METFNLAITKDLAEEKRVTQEMILQRVSEEDILQFYGIPIQKGLFCSRLRKDHKPTVGVYRNKRGKVIVHDFGDGSYYDCFSYVMALFNVSYYMALQIIANDFNIVPRNDLTPNKAKIKSTGAKVEEQQSAIIQIQTREFKQNELNWWIRYGINPSTLKKFHVYPVDAVWLNGNLFYTNTNNQPVFGYYGGIKNKIEQWRIYYPNRKVGKWLSNWKSTQIQGTNMIPKDGGDYIVVTKSLKDCMALYEFGVPAIAPCSENLFLTESQYNRIKTKFKRVYLLYDLDIPGVRATKKIKQDFPDIQVLLMPWGTAKDFSDYRKAFGYRKTLELVNKTKAYYGEM